MNYGTHILLATFSRNLLTHLAFKNEFKNICLVMCLYELHYCCNWLSVFIHIYSNKIKLFQLITRYKIINYNVR